jgi:hypothetical protein
MSKVITANDVRDAVRRDVMTITADHGAIITSEARDVAKSAGVEIEQGSSGACCGAGPQPLATVGHASSFDSGSQRPLTMSHYDGGSPLIAAIAEPMRALLPVDAHVHIGRARWMSEDVSADTVLDLMKASGVAKSCVFPFADREMDASEAVWAATRGRRNLIPFALCNPLEPGSASKLRAFLLQGFRGIKMHPTAHGYPLDQYDIVDPIFELAREFSAPIVCHCFSDTPFNTAGQFKDLAGRFPQVDLIALHGGFMWHTAGLAEAARTLPNLFLETSTVYPNLLRKHIADVGVEHFIFGSDTPFNSSAAELGKLQLSVDSIDDLKELVSGNLSRILAKRG